MTSPHTVDLDGPVHYLSYEGPKEGPSFVLVHGLGGSHTNWLSLAPRLAARGPVWVPDLAGFGRTPLAGRSATVEANRALLDRFIAEVAKDDVILVGNSMGGTISMLQSVRAPESVAGLVLIDPGVSRVPGQVVDRLVAGLFATYMIPKVGERFVEARVRIAGPEALARQTLAMCCVDPERVDPELVAATIALAHERMQMPWATDAFLQAARSIVRLLARRKAFNEMVHRIAAPTLLLMGRHDRLVPLAAARAVAQIRPDWDFVIFDDLGHVPQMEDPVATMNAIGEWLDGSARRLLGGRARSEETG